MSFKRIFVLVTIAALVGMVLGGLFGFAGAKLTPDFFRHVVPWQDIEPTGFATFAGAMTGVLLGGGLGCFAVVVQLIADGRKKREG